MKREDIVTEQKLRKYIRNKITESFKKQKTQELNEEAKLRQIIRSILKESDISDIHPHRSTGINVLEDLLKKMIPTLRTDYKRLTTSKEQRDSFRAHIVNAIKKSLLPSLVNDKFVQGDTVDPGMLMAQPSDDDVVDVPPEPELDAEVDDELSDAFEDELVEQEIEIAIGDDPDPAKKVDAGLEDDKPNEEEDFASGVEDQNLDETGRNMSFTTFKKIQQYILDAYDLLRDPQDKKVFVDYLITNTKLYLDKFEDELQNTVNEPTTPEYENTKGA
tara:strand:- start:77 stop:901 length:825 start_codon:yes stop_codon:yes gene_type:complete